MLPANPNRHPSHLVHVEGEGHQDEQRLGGPSQPSFHLYFLDLVCHTHLSHHVRIPLDIRRTREIFYLLHDIWNQRGNFYRLTLFVFGDCGVEHEARVCLELITSTV